MDALFSNNLMVIFVIAAMTVLSFAELKENQRIALIYIFTYTTRFFGVFKSGEALILLLVTSFIFVEFLTIDVKKLNLFTSISYKTTDYIFMMITQYHYILVVSAILYLDLENISTFARDYIDYYKVISALLLFCGILRTITQPFKVKSITEICKVFDKILIYDHSNKYTNLKVLNKYNLLCEIEDKSYFYRKNSYSCFSIEYFSYIINTHIKKRKSDENRNMNLLKFSKRGYSTPEMQLLRHIAIERGYDKYKYSRKLFEIVYSKIFYTSLKIYHQSNTYQPLDHFKHYLLYVYINTVPTKIKDSKYIMANTFRDSSIDNWSMEGFFIACLGLSFRTISNSNLDLYSKIMDKYGIDRDRVKYLYNKFPAEKFPNYSDRKVQRASVRLSKPDIEETRKTNRLSNKQK